ncbi:HlyD family efflux transporter periplasmic adaptor subunit [Ancylomarina euxinus]|uniref:HlyD family efflux transporter periplasmic adaptor subunit n=1 Tax=Ancylomarina euxinus TaxID=2283627 RepID=A0A425Y7J2_9BACT|nr:HlyD family efflux transporter periplasmic adaptor subunit [Ancylomarina euxinus]MCZ4693651.1 HlyD family efflux transporter periplasmic adaptor subunit [Ancylomarina euxinus]MUP13880.1 HlyD family efflux transporter periplasmic adaptor subunit [Ancylomarina euxinus]RRG24491.1 HlyD family efflux transporter periplasmic adaptor subunit [Ancylomarina euxinus]
MEQDTNIELRSESVQEILGKMPSWIVRVGSGLVFLVVLILVIGSWFFSYPEIISSKLVLTTENPPAELIARVNGKIIDLKVSDNQLIEAGDLLAVIENPANSQDVFSLRKQLNNQIPQFDGKNEMTPEFVDKNYRLGEVQAPFNAYLKACTDYSRFVDLQYHEKKKASLIQKRSNYRMYYNRQYKQRNILEKELAIVYKEFHRDSLLYTRGVISKANYQQSEKEYLQQSYAFHGSRSTLSSTQIQINEVDQSIIDLDLDEENKRKELLDQILHAYDNLTAQIDIWEQNYLLKSPITGAVSFNRFWSANQNVKQGEKVFTVLPSDSTRIIVRVDLGMNRSGKVQLGQRVNIKLNNYPYMEFGMLEGSIRSISEVPDGDNYSLDVELTNGLITSYGKELKFAQKIEGVAEIITEDQRLLQRIFNPLKALLKEHVVK